MTFRRWGVGVVTAALLVPAVVACTSDDTEPAASPSATGAVNSAEAKAALLAAAEELRNGSYVFSLSLAAGGEGVHGAGRVHRPSASAEYVMANAEPGSTAVTQETLVIIADGGMWVRIRDAEASPDSAERYQQVDLAKVTGQTGGSSSFPVDIELTGASMVEAVREVRQTGERLYAGTIDPAGITISNLFEEELGKALTDQGTTVPFSAKLDAQGRLVELGVDVPAVDGHPAQNLLITYADYGAVSAVQKPPAEKIVEASAEVYEMFG